MFSIYEVDGSWGWEVSGSGGITPEVWGSEFGDPEACGLGFEDLKVCGLRFEDLEMERVKNALEDKNVVEV